MPLAPAHKKLTIITSFAAFSLLLVKDIPVFVAFEAGILTTLVINPDADLAQGLGVIGDFMGLEAYEDEMIHRFGLSRNHWRKYGWKTVMGSHVPLIGSLFRLLPILILLSLTLLWSFLQPYWYLLVVYLLGISLSDTVHIIADELTTRFKRWRNGRTHERRFYR